MMNKNIILIVDDIELNRDILCMAFEEKYEIDVYKRQIQLR